MNQLAKIDRARQELIEARAIPEVKSIIDKAEAIAQYMKQQNYSKEIQDYANEFCIDAQLKLGKLLKDMPKNEGSKGQLISRGVIGPTKTEGPIQDPPTYADLGIDYKDASRLQRAAEHSEAIAEKVAEVKAKGQPVIASRVINQVLQDIQKEERKYNQAMPLPERKYRTIVIDPPWPIEKILRDVTPNQEAFAYSTMTLEEIGNFPISDIAQEDGCHIYLWTTQKYLPIAFEILDAWGFKYIFTMVWHKNGGFQPFNLPQYNCEFILFGRMGALEFTTIKNFFCCFNGKRMGHSIKPDEFYDIIREVSPEPRIDIFNRRHINGFDRYGTEVEAKQEVG